MDFNRVNLIGRLTKDPELKITKAGNMAIFNIAVNKSNNREEANFFRVVSWGTAAGVVAKVLKKGRLALVVGELSNSSYEKNGEKRYATDIVLKEFKALDRPVALEDTPMVEPTAKKKKVTK